MVAAVLSVIGDVWTLQGLRFSRMRGGRVLLWALLGLVLLAFFLIEGSAAESAVSRPKARLSGLPKVSIQRTLSCTS